MNITVRMWRWKNHISMRDNDVDSRYIATRNCIFLFVKNEYSCPVKVLKEYLPLLPILK